MNSVLKKYNNYSEEYFNKKTENNIRYDKLFNESEIYLKDILDTINQNNLLENSLMKAKMLLFLDRKHLYHQRFFVSEFQILRA